MNRTTVRMLYAAAGIVLLLSVSCTSSAYSKELCKEYYTIAQAYDTQKNYSKAIEYYKKSRGDESLAAAATYELARLYILDKKYTEAETELRQLLIREPDNGLLLSAQAYALACLKRYPESLDCYRKLRDRNELELATGRNYLSLLYTAGEYEEMQDLLKQFAELYPDDEGLKKLDILYGLKGGRESGKDDAVAWLQLDSNGTDPAVLTALAEYYSANDLFDDALNIYTKLTAEYKTPAVLLEMSYLAYDKATIDILKEQNGGTADTDEKTPKENSADTEKADEKTESQKDSGSEYLNDALKKITDDEILEPYLERLSSASRKKAKDTIAAFRKQKAADEAADKKASDAGTGTTDKASTDAETGTTDKASTDAETGTTEKASADAGTGTTDKASADAGTGTTEKVPTDTAAAETE